MLGIFLDTETNGLNAKKHKILEIAFKLIDLRDGRLVHAYENTLMLTKEEWEQSDPASLSVNGFKWEMISKGCELNQVAHEIEHIFKSYSIKRGQAVFICQNPSFDRAFFSQLIDPDTQEKHKWPYHWLDLASMFFSRTMLEAKLGDTPYPWDIGFTKDKIAQYYDLGSEGMPHRAMNGVNHLIKCYSAVVGFPLQAKSASVLS